MRRNVYVGADLFWRWLLLRDGFNLRSTRERPVRMNHSRLGWIRMGYVKRYVTWCGRPGG